MSGTSDNCVFAGSPEVASQAVFTCRLVSVSLPAGGQLAPNAKTGLMARASLSDGSAAVGVLFAGHNGLHVMGPLVDGVTLSDQSGLTPQTLLGVAASPPAHGNWLLRPLWLRLHVTNNTWQAWSSTDGKAWTAAGSPVTLLFIGAWVGVFVSSHTGGQLLEAVFDNVSGFRASTAVQIGTA